MRIIAGMHRGRILAEFKGYDIRPTSDRVKESLFDILNSEIFEARVLDLFCGSGSLGLEAISRGASEVIFNDVSEESLKVLNQNLSKIKESAKVCNLDYKAFLLRENKPYDIIFLDPPYKEDFGKTALELISDYKLLTDEGIIVYERDKAFTDEIPSLEKYDERKYGKTYITFFRFKK
jgi:16S rRNA (guanine(966)-N(2))-methyltransferase RsmD